MRNVILSIQSSHHTPFLHNSKNRCFSFYHPASFLLFHIFTFQKFPLALSSFLSISIPISLSLPLHKFSPLCAQSLLCLLRILLPCSHSSLLCFPHLSPFPMPSSMTLLPPLFLAYSDQSKYIPSKKSVEKTPDIRL